MANSKISALTAATTPVAGTETLPIVQSGVTKQVSIANLTAGRAVSMASVTLTSGTANGVAYLNGSQLVITDPTKLYFDGTNFGIGRTPSAKLDVEGAAIVRGTITPTDAIRMGGNTSTPSGSDAFIYRPTDNTLGLGTASTDRFWIDVNGNMVVKGAAKGINFTANTPAAGMTSQLLNWYEEGTWTPNQGAGLTLVGAFSSAGTYTRVGRQIFVQGSVSGATSVAAASAGAITSNLPFSAVADATGAAINAANTASSVLRVSSATLTAATAVAATATITFSATYSV